jgi:hypothetical protein
MFSYFGEIREQNITRAGIFKNKYQFERKFVVKFFCIYFVKSNIKSHHPLQECFLFTFLVIFLHIKNFHTKWKIYENYRLIPCLFAVRETSEHKKQLI